MYKVARIYDTRNDTEYICGPTTSKRLVHKVADEIFKGNKIPSESQVERIADKKWFCTSLGLGTFKIKFKENFHE